MSWLVDLAGKAESFLDNIDKKAADVVGSDAGSNNVKTAPSHTRAIDVERNISRTSDNPLSGRASASNVSATNSKYCVDSYCISRKSYYVSKWLVVKTLTTFCIVELQLT